MDYSTFFVNILASVFLVLQRTLSLILSPYKAMRKISKETDVLQIFIIFALIFIYFFFANKVRPFTYEYYFLFLLTIFHYLLTVYFFYYISSIFQKGSLISSFAFSLAYSLIPTLVWFIANSFLYILLPPPRTTSMMGKAFSLVYISFIVSLLLWKLILTYLAVRFSSRLNVVRVVYFMLLYLIIVLPYALYLYLVGLFRIPFI